MASNSFGGTLTSGIQDISALLPLLGTDQCEQHVSCALDKGFLYASAAPLSIFGSLGVVKVGIRVLLASLNFRFHLFNFVGASWLENTGLSDGSEGGKHNVASLIILNRHGSRFVAEDRLDAMLDEAHIDDVTDVDLEWQSSSWNVWLILCTSITAAVAFVPYIPLLLEKRHIHSHMLWVDWVFPLLRGFGTSLTAVTVQAILQFRVLDITRKRLLLKRLESDDNFRVVLDGIDFSMSADKCIWQLKQKIQKNYFSNRLGGGMILRHMVSYLKYAFIPLAARTDLESQESPSSPSNAEQERENLKELLEKKFPTSKVFSRVSFLLMLQGLTFVGLLMSILGYVGCFSAVQASSTTRGPIIWLGVELSLSIIRIMIWGSNPQWDEMTSIRFHLKLRDQPPSITCNKSQEDIQSKQQEFAVLRADNFLKDLTIYTGPIEPFIHDKVSLYYTFTGNRGSGKMVLCVTIFDYTERAAWTLVVDSWAIINSENALEYFSKSLFSATLEVDSKQNDPMVKLHDKGETDHLSNPIIQDRTFITKLKKHCHSIICGFDRQKRISEIHLCWSLNVLPPLARAEVKIGGIKSDLVKGKGVVANMKLNSVEGTGLRVSENAHSPWHCLDTSDQLYMWIGEFQKIFTHYRDNRRKWIQHASEVLSSASTAAVKDLQQYRQKSSGSADVLGNLELLARRVTDIEEHVRMEIVWLWEAHALLVTLFYLLARNARCYKDWSEHTGKIFSVELDAFQDRMKIHATRLLDDTNNLVNVFIAKRVILGGLNQEIQKLWTNSSSIDVLRADLDNQPRPPTAFHIMALWKEKLLLGIDQSEAKFSTIQRKLTSLLRPKLNKAGHDPTTILNALFTRARAPMKQRMDAEYGAAEARLHQILDFPITSYTSAEATSFVEKMIEAITPYTNSNITRLVDVTFNNRRHSHLDIGMTTNDRMPLEEFCQIIVRNQYASVISLGGEGYPQTGASTLRQCADALAQRSGTSSISIVMKNATFDNNAVDALLHAAKQNHRIVSLQLRHDLSIPKDLDRAMQNLNDVIQKNRQIMETESCTTDIFYEHDPEGFNIRGYKYGWVEINNKCVVCFTTQLSKNAYPLYVYIVIEFYGFYDNAEPIILQLNGKTLSFKSTNVGSDDTLRYYILLPKDNLLNSEPHRNHLELTANTVSEFRSSFTLLDLKICDHTGNDWNGPENFSPAVSGTEQWNI